METEYCIKQDRIRLKLNIMQGQNQMKTEYFKQDRLRLNLNIKQGRKMETEYQRGQKK